MNAMPHVRIRVIALFAILALAAAACGGGDDAATEEPVAPATTEAAVAPTTEAAEATEAPAPEPTAEPEPEPTEDKPEEEAPTPEPVVTTEAPAPTAEPLDESTDGAVPDAGEAMDVGGETTYDSYTVITDDAGTIQVEVPTEWDEVDGRPFTDGAGRQLYDVRTAPDLQGFNETWDVPGIIVTASSDVAQTANEITLLDELVDPLSAQCTYLGREAYDDGLYTGQADIYDLCGGTQTGYVVIGAVPDTRAFVIRVEVQVTEERDLEALNRAIETFQVIGDV